MSNEVGRDQAVERREDLRADGPERFEAFISYKHGGDSGVAAELQRGLQQFNKPVLSLRVRRVLRDETDLDASPHLWDGIRERVLRSDYLVLCASPESARSKWVELEVSEWLPQGPNALDRLAVVTTGLPPSAGTGDRWNSDPSWIEEVLPDSFLDQLTARRRPLDELLLLHATSQA